jgi:light-regulated signal transduction histidine kinase (bacteriophytochrome)
LKPRLVRDVEAVLRTNEVVREAAEDCASLVGQLSAGNDQGQRRGSDRSGLGLGLSIARKAVSAHGGEIVTRNMPGKGCVFVIDIPLAPDEVPICI